MIMKIGGRYNWIDQIERLIFIGRNWSGNGYWNQFAKVDNPEEVWCEVLDSDLHMLEETQNILNCDFNELKRKFANTQSEIDLHTERACKEFNCTPEQVTKEMRKFAKKLNLISMYSFKPRG